MFWNKRRKMAHRDSAHYVERKKAAEDFDAAFQLWSQVYDSWEIDPNNQECFPVSRILILQGRHLVGKTLFLEKQKEKYDSRNLRWVYVPFRNSGGKVDKLHALVRIRQAMDNVGLRTPLLDYALNRYRKVVPDIPALNDRKIAGAEAVADLSALIPGLGKLVNSNDAKDNLIETVDDVVELIGTLGSMVPGMVLGSRMVMHAYRRWSTRHTANFKHYIEQQSLSILYYVLDMFLLLDLLKIKQRICLVFDDCECLSNEESSVFYQTEPWYVPLAMLSHSLVVFSGTVNPFQRFQEVAASSKYHSWISEIHLEALKKRDVFVIATSLRVPLNVLSCVMDTATRMPGILQLCGTGASEVLGISKRDLKISLTEELKSIDLALRQPERDQDIFKRILDIQLRSLSDSKRNLVKQSAWFSWMTWDESLQLMPAAKNNITLWYELIKQPCYAGYIDTMIHGNVAYYCCSTDIAELARQSYSMEETEAMIQHLRRIRF